MNARESTPSVNMNLHARLPSTWRDPIGKQLSDKRIEFYARLGRYGAEVKRRLTEGLVVRPCQRPECKSTHTQFYRFGYLPRAMWLCDKCRETYREEHEELVEQHKRQYRVTSFV